MIKTSLILPANPQSDGVYLRGEFSSKEGNKTLCFYVKSNYQYSNVWEQKDKFNSFTRQLGTDYANNDNTFIIESLTGMFMPLYDDVWVVIGERTDDDPMDKWVLQVHDESGSKPDWLYHFGDEFIYP